MLAGDCGIRSTTLFDTAGYRSRVAAEVDIDAVDEGTAPLERRRRSRSDRIGLRAASEALADAGVLGQLPIDRSRVGVFLAQARRICSETRSSTAPGSPVAFAELAVRISGITFRARPSTSSPATFGFEGPRALCRRRLLVEHDCDRAGVPKRFGRPR